MTDKWHGGMSDRDHFTLWKIECLSVPVLRDLLICFDDPERWGRLLAQWGPMGTRVRAYDQERDQDGP